MIPEKYLSIMACPTCKGILLQADNGNNLLCIPCDLSYPVRDGIPVMIPDEAVIIQEQGARGKAR